MLGVTSSQPVLARIARQASRASGKILRNIIEKHLPGAQASHLRAEKWIFRHLLSCKILLRVSYHTVFHTVIPMKSSMMTTTLVNAFERFVFPSRMPRDVNPMHTRKCAGTRWCTAVERPSQKHYSKTPEMLCNIHSITVVCDNNVAVRCGWRKAAPGRADAPLQWRPWRPSSLMPPTPSTVASGD